MQPEDVAKQYFNAVRTRDIELFMTLFAADAVFILPDGKEVVAAAAIRVLEQSVFDNGAPQPAPTSFIVGAHAVAVEIDVHLPGGQVMKAANFYQLNEAGLIQRLSVYRKT